MGTVSSLAGTGRKYAVIQGRVEGGTLKIQGHGPSVNRDYGLSITVPIPGEMASWMKGIKADIKSLASSSSARYFPMQSAEMDEGENKVRVQVAGSKLNRSYGAVFSVANTDLATFTTLVLDSEVETEDEDEHEDEYPEELVVELI